MIEKMAVETCGQTLVIDCNLRIRRVDHGIGSLPIIEVSDNYKISYLAEILQQELDGDDSKYSDCILFGKARIMIQKRGGDNG